MNKDVQPEMGEGLESIQTIKELVQLSWHDISIVANPPTGRCKPRGGIKEPKTIIDGVSGTVMPGQFLAIIGASGNFSFCGQYSFMSTSTLKLFFRCW
jgi:hypothetical protein